MKLDAALMRLIAHMTQRDRMDANAKSAVIDPAFRILTAFLCVLLCACSKNAVFTLIIITVQLVRLALLKPAQIRAVCHMVGTAALIALFITLPSLFYGSTAEITTIVMKVTEAILIIGILNETLAWKEITGAFARLHVPGIVIMTMDMAIHFLVILGRYCDRMLEAVQLRSMGEVSWKDSQIGGILGTTFLKSDQMAQGVSDALVCRGYTGAYPIYEQHQRTVLDYLYLLVLAGMILLFIYTENIL